jgi:uncharacterized membrane protein YhaH (DUF805 family)
MSFGDAIRTCFAKYATFNGRARRSEYWYWYLFIVLGFIVFSVLDRWIGWEVSTSAAGAGWLSVIFALAIAIPSLAVTFRRLHDTDRSGWWWLLSLVCGIGALIVFIFCLMDSRPDNQYGPNPKGGGGLVTA